MDVSRHAEFITNVKKYQVVFRADASLNIGSGHIMRCLALAGVLRANGWSTKFICRDHPGNLINLVCAQGHAVGVLPKTTGVVSAKEIFITPRHPEWLGVSWEVDAIEVINELDGARPDWLVVDHYALDARWELSLRPKVGRILVIDDIAVSQHAPDFLLNQNFGASPKLYQSRVPSNCRLLLGTAYALLRPEFARTRRKTIIQQRRECVSHMVLSMGGVDAIDATSVVLEILAANTLPTSIKKISVVMGESAPWLLKVGELCKRFVDIDVELLVNVADMPALLSRADFAIGAAGSSAWERCALGVPSILVVVAENQRSVALELKKAGAALVIESISALSKKLLPMLSSLVESKESLRIMSWRAQNLCDGRGVYRVQEEMILSL